MNKEDAYWSGNHWARLGHDGAVLGLMASQTGLGGYASDLCSAMGNCPPNHRTPEDWLLLGRKTAQALAEKGDSEAMYVLYYLTNSLEWLEKSAEVGFPIAQYDLARLYEPCEFQQIAISRCLL
ncbi:hypothetical protein EWH21_13000 [Pseudomonas sp. REST10]|uniref:hypothetical protein n=1 Tax=Pseudomonas sp. REST10 TaxID=2512235 RepID=UPI00240E8402|nr:hypothetical protein [Pseudomonas sp. REST10]WFC62597.1 hypothetical protein EWH21_13000 [Pseudomonas sp. REST10]